MDVTGFVLYLHQQRDRVAALGELRRGSPLADRHMLPWCGPDDDTAPMYLVGALFGEAPGPGGDGRSLGVQYRAMVDALPSDSTAMRQSYEARFRALLDAPADDLARHLRHAVTKLAQRRHAIAWERLLLDVLHWNDDGRPIQHRLAREMWG